MKRNSNLYEEMYDNVEYSNVEGIAKIEKTDEIDLSRIKELIQEHEKQKNPEKRISKTIVVEKHSEVLEDDKQYDLKQFLLAAKKDRPKEERERYAHSMKYTMIADKMKELEDSDVKLNDLTNVEALKQLEDSELSLELLNDLTTDENTFIESLSTTSAEEENSEMDNTFYTKNIKFSKEDFEELDDINKNLKKNNIWITLLVFIILVIIITTCLFLFQNIL